MKLVEVLNKFTNDNFLLTVKGLCDEMPFYEYEDEKKKEYWKKYRDRKIVSMSIFITNQRPELFIELEKTIRDNYA